MFIDLKERGRERDPEKEGEGERNTDVKEKGNLSVAF